MNLGLKDQLFVIGGATSGFGAAVARTLVTEGAKIIAVARREALIHAFMSEFPDQIEGITGDLTKSSTIQKVIQQVGGRKLHGVLVNAGGPPAKSFLETTLEDWDNAYHNVMRWKIELTQALLPHFQQQRYGRLVYVESLSVKQPIENLVLSNSIRLGVVGFVKTLSQEVAKEGITLNILGPGYHATPAMDRLFQKQSKSKGITIDEARQSFENIIPVGHLGDPNDFAHLASWLLSESSRYITGQTISVDGGAVYGIMG